MKQFHLMTFKTAADAAATIHAGQKYLMTRLHRIGRWVWWWE